MSTARRVLLAIVVGGLAVGCDVLPVVLPGGQQIVMEVANHSPRPATLAVAVHGDVSKIVGSVTPAIIQAGATATVRFTVPPTDDWAIWANDGELMSDLDLHQRRGNIPMGIDIGSDGSPSWWCKADCP